MAGDFYDGLATHYDQMTDQPARLRIEVPFIVEQLKKIGGHEILDIGCGTGGHARMLGIDGFKVLGIDSSRAMIDKALSNGPVEGVRFQVATIADLATRETERFDAVLCLGNTLPHLVCDEVSLAKVSRQIAPLLRRGGFLIGQIVNVPWVETSSMRMLPVRVWNKGGKKHIVTRHYINTGGNSLMMIVSQLTQRSSDTHWRASAYQQRLLKIVPMELERAFDSGPWADYRCFSGWSNDPVDVNSPSIVFITTRR